MAKNRSDSSKYESRHGGGWITSAQFLAEVMCERYAKKNGEELVYKFWNVDFWKKEFFKQLAFAKKLLLVYEPHIISRALRSKEGKSVFSLGAPWLKKIIELEQRKFKSADTSKVIDTTELPIRKPFQSFKSLMKKLKDLDNE